MSGSAMPKTIQHPKAFGEPQTQSKQRPPHHENEYLASQRMSEADGAACLFGLSRSMNHTNQSNRENGSA
jgi:hypothetical protein